MVLVAALIVAQHSQPAPANAGLRKPALSPKLRANPISEIAIQHRPGLALDAHDYTLILRSDGTATYIGFGGSTGMDGTYSTRVPASSFTRVAAAIDGTDFFQWASCYGPIGDDIPEVRISVVRTRERKTIIDCGSQLIQPHYEVAPPKGLGDIETRIDAVVSGAAWTKVSEKAAQPQFDPKPWISASVAAPGPAVELRLHWKDMPLTVKKRFTSFYGDYFSRYGHISDSYMFEASNGDDAFQLRRAPAEWIRGEIKRFGLTRYVRVRELPFAPSIALHRAKSWGTKDY